MIYQTYKKHSNFSVELFHGTFISLLRNTKAHTQANTNTNTPARVGSFVQGRAGSICERAAGVGVCGVSGLSMSEERRPSGRTCKDPVDHCRS